MPKDLEFGPRQRAVRRNMDAAAARRRTDQALNLPTAAQIASPRMLVGRLLGPNGTGPNPASNIPARAHARWGVIGVI